MANQELLMESAKVAEAEEKAMAPYLKALEVLRYDINRASPGDFSYRTPFDHSLVILKSARALVKAAIKTIPKSDLIADSSKRLITEYELAKGYTCGITEELMRLISEAKQKDEEHQWKTNPVVMIADIKNLCTWLENKDNEFYFEDSLYGSDVYSRMKECLAKATELLSKLDPKIKGGEQ